MSVHILGTISMNLEPCPRVIIGGTLIDGTGRPPIKDSVIVIKDEWITAVGKRDQVEIPPGAEIIDASGKTVLPGLIDAHVHFVGLGVRMIQNINLRGAKTISEALEKVKTRIAEVEKGVWILGRGWDDSKWEDRRYITKYDLDPISPDNPVILTRVCGHLVSINSQALEIAGITKDTPDPKGGEIDRTPEGEPTGVLKDASHLVRKHVPRVNDEINVEGLKRASEYALSLGCTSIQEAGIEAPKMRAYQTALEKGYLKVRAYLMWTERNIEAMKALGLRTGFGNNMLRLGSAKMLVDGSIGARTAAFFEPYEDEQTTKGIVTIPEDELIQRVKAVHRTGSQVAIHAIGDYAIETTINAIEAAIRDSPRKDHRHRIEHCEVLTSTQIERIKQLGIIPSVQPNFAGEWSDPGGLYETRIGKKRLRQNNPYRYLLDEGIRLSFGSDGMPFNPIYGIWSAVNHWIRESRITLEEAVRGFTLDAAYASFEEDMKGSVEVGKLADIAILEQDLTEIPSNEIRDVPVHMTLVGGKIMYYNE
jgi:predicted amidohydrolase YtcJ